MAALLIVDQLPHHFSDEELLRLFRPFGKISSCRIVRDHAGRSLNFAFVELENAEEAARAVQALDGKKVDDHSIRVNPVKDLPTGAG